MNRMLINATQAEELRVAIVKQQYLYDLDIERAGQIKKKANIYKGRITRIEPSLEAAFVEFGSARQGFLPLKEIAEEYFQSPLPADGSRPNIKDLVKEGQELIIQVEKDERGTKGAALTTYITLAGCYLVLMTNNPKSGGISRRIEGEERDELREALRNLQMPDGMGVIVRTAGMGKNAEDLQWDLDVLIRQWDAIKNAAKSRAAPFLIHEEGDLIIRSIRDNLRKDIDEIIIDDPDSYVKAKNHLQEIRPELLHRLKLYQDTIPLFNRYQIESQIETAYKREVILPSGGSLVIDRTEALVSIDINSAKATGGADIETTAFNTNLEAADEIARQLRLRDLGGLIVIDFIDMNPTRHQREVENRLREALRSDRARVQIGRISRFGLLEMSRQRLRLSLGETTSEVCPRCVGRGTLRSTQSLGLSLVRLIEEDAIKENTGQIQVQVPIEAATFLMNEQRESIRDIEKRHQVQVLIIPNQYLETPHYKIARLRLEELPEGFKQKLSFELVDQPEPEVPSTEKSSVKRAEPAVKHMPTPKRDTEKAGFIKRLWTMLFGPAKPAQKPSTHKEQQRRHHGGGRGRHQQKSQQRRPSSGRRQRSDGSRRRHHHSGGQRNRPQQSQSNDRQQQMKSKSTGSKQVETTSNNGE